MLTNMTASTAAIDPRMAWCDDTYLNTPTLVPSNEDNSHTRDVYGQEQYPNEFYSPFSSTIQTQSTPKTSERLPYPMPFDWTPEGRNLNSPPSWMANQSTPTRMSNKTRQSLPLFCDDGNGHNFASNSPHSAIDFQPTSMSMISPTNTHPNIIAYTPRRASGPAAFASMNALQPQTQLVSTKTHEGHPNAIKANESCRMPPPPVPKHAHRKSLLPTKTQHRLSEELYAKLAEQHSSQLLPIFDGRNCDQTQPKTLPPQYRALYNASTVGPTQYAREVVTSKSVKRSSLTQNVLLQTIFNKKIVNKIASHLTETDALSFALSSPSIYHRLDDEWWKTTFPVRDEEQSKKSAWVYLWPHSHGWCSFCTRWKRIVMHEPSKAHVCFECMQLPHFKVVSFSAARSRFKVGNSVAIHFFSQLPSVQDGKARYFWICHLQWVEAQCRIMDAALELIKNKPIMCKSNKERSSVKPSGGTSKRSRKGSVSQSALPKQKKAKKVNQDDTFEDPQSGKSDVSNESKDDIDTTYCDDSSDLTSFDGLDDEDAEGDTDDEYIPESRAERKAYNVKTKTRAKSPAKIVVEPRTRSRTFTGPFSNRERRNSATIRNRRAKSSPAPSDMPQSRDGEDEEHDESVYICTSNERSMSIVREVRREYIVKELEAIDGCPNTQFEIPDMFVQGQWDVMEKLGIQHNDWNAMATWIIRKSTLKEGIRAEELD